MKDLSVETSGDWKGFHTQQEVSENANREIHFAGTYNLAHKFGVGTPKELSKKIAEFEVQYSIRKIANLGGETFLYCYEDIVAVPEMQKWLRIRAEIQKETEGEYEGLYKDQESEYWGSYRRLAQETEKPGYQKVSYAVARRKFLSGLVRSREIATNTFELISVYSLTDFLKSLNSEDTE